MRVLLFGNSQMFYHNLPRMLEYLTASAPANHAHLDITAVTEGGASLESLWNKGESPNTPRALIREGLHDRVVMQEIFCAERPSFETHAAYFDSAIRASGAETLLFVTAQVSERYDARYVYPESFRRFSDMQQDFGLRHGIRVAEGGGAWVRYLGANPPEGKRLGLYHPDFGHPGRKGTYLYACTLYAELTGQSPEGLVYDLPDIPGEALDPAEARAMQRAAWETRQACERNRLMGY